MLGATSLLSSWTLLAMTMVRKVPAVNPCSLFGKHLSRKKGIISEEKAVLWIRIRNDLAVLEPDPYRECESGFGSRSVEIDQN
jgi:hypothetical protein